MKNVTIALVALSMLIACSARKASVNNSTGNETDAVFRQANEKMSKGYYEEARGILEKIRSQDSTGKYAALAQLRIGDTYFDDGLYEESALEYQRFLDLYPSHKYAPHAQYKLAMGYFNRIEGHDVSYSQAQGALREFERLLTLYPRNPYVKSAENRIKMCKKVLAEYEFYVGKFYFKKGSHRAAALRFSGILQNYPHSQKVPEALYYLALSHRNMEDKDRAVDTLTTLIEKYPTSALAHKAEEIIDSFQKLEQ